MGLHYCITCNEFVNRIQTDEIEPAIARKLFLEPWRVRDQMAACKEWPKTELPADFFEPFQLEKPTVLVSGAAKTQPQRRLNGSEKAKSYHA